MTALTFWDFFFEWVQCRGKKNHNKLKDLTFKKQKLLNIYIKVTAFRIQMLIHR